MSLLAGDRSWLRAHLVPAGVTMMLGAAVVSGCAAPPAASAGRSPSPSLGAQWLLPGTALPGLVSHDRPLSPGLVAQDANLPAIPAELTAAGYLGGDQRTFQGPSRHLSFVQSRSLQFRTPAGAAAFMEYLRGHAGAWFGAFTQTTDLLVGGGRGYAFAPPACACHLANPVLVGVVRTGARLAWLEINGPDATRSELVGLLKATDRTLA